MAKGLGATHTINYRSHPDWAKEVLRPTEGVGVDLVVEVGGAATIEQSLKSLRQGGVASVGGILSPGQATDLIPAILYGANIGKS